MSIARTRLERILAKREGERAADGLAEVVEEYIEFCGTAEDYFATLLRLPGPLLELYAALIFNSMVGMDGLAFAIPRYENPQFMAALGRGLKLLGEDKLLAIIERASKHLGSGASAAWESAAPNVTLDRELDGISKKYFAQRKQLMPKIGRFLHANRKLVLDAASQLDAPRP